jgi:hypothetical protein
MMKRTTINRTITAISKLVTPLFTDVFGQS